MREIRLYGSEGGEAKNLSYPYYHSPLSKGGIEGGSGCPTKDLGHDGKECGNDTDEVRLRI